MPRGISRETIGVTEDHSWLASRHGLDTPRTIQLDAALCAAVFTDGLIKSGLIIARVTATGRWGPVDTLGPASDGRQLTTDLRILYTTKDIRQLIPDGTFVNIEAAAIAHGQVLTYKLPRSSAQTGGPASAVVSAMPQVKFF